MAYENDIGSWCDKHSLCSVHPIVVQGSGEKGFRKLSQVRFEGTWNQEDDNKLNLSFQLTIKYHCIVNWKEN